jgi:hypothetical protein
MIVSSLREFAFGVEIATVFYLAARELYDLFNFIIHYLLLCTNYNSLNKKIVIKYLNMIITNFRGKFTLTKPSFQLYFSILFQPLPPHSPFHSTLCKFY